MLKELRKKYCRNSWRSCQLFCLIIREIPIYISEKVPVGILEKVPRKKKKTPDQLIKTLSKKFPKKYPNLLSKESSRKLSNNMHIKIFKTISRWFTVKKHRKSSNGLQIELLKEFTKKFYKKFLKKYPERIPLKYKQISNWFAWLPKKFSNKFRKKFP